MGGRQAFGPNLRRTRVQRGISLDEIARRTKVSVELWEGLERNDFARWPAGIFARAYIREYAHAIGADSETTVDEFCRWFEQGDRRARRIVSGQAEIVGHELAWQDDLTVPDRRAPARPGSAADTPAAARRFSPRARVLIGLGDVAAISVAAALLVAATPLSFWTAAGMVALLYQVCALAALGASPAVALVHWYIDARRPSARAATQGLRILRGTERVKV